MSADVVIDTNVVLDLFLFHDPAAVPLREALHARRLRWIATAAMRAECERVLGYDLVQRQLAARGRAAPDVLRAFDALAQVLPEAPAADVRCADPEDQMFVDLAVAQRAPLVSRDKELLRLRRRLQACGVAVAPAIG
jgi:putative PIN family toxin of toxin-antitoxin system